VSAPPVGTANTREVSPECALARRPGYEDVHTECRALQDVPLPHSRGLLLARSCGCDCHRPTGEAEQSELEFRGCRRLGDSSARAGLLAPDL
jgi:hypothetical protein